MTSSLLLQQASSVMGRQEIDVRPVDELRGRDAERCHQGVSLLDASLRNLALGQDHLELEKVAKLLDPVQVDARSADEVERAVFAHAPSSTVGERQRFAQRVGGGGRGD